MPYLSFVPKTPTLTPTTTPRQFDHAVPSLDVFSEADNSVDQTKESNAQDRDGMPSEAFRTLLLNNFKHMNACHLEMMTKLAKTEAKVLETGGQVNKLLEISVTGGSRQTAFMENDPSFGKASVLSQSKLWDAPPRQASGISSRISAQTFGGASTSESRDFSLHLSKDSKKGILKSRSSQGGSNLLSNSSFESTDENTPSSIFDTTKQLAFGSEHQHVFKAQDSLVRRSSTKSSSNPFIERESVDDMENLARLVSRHATHQRGITKHIWEFLENRMSSRWAFYYGSYFVPLFVTYSAALAFLQSAGSITWSTQAFVWIQSGFEICFLIEVVIRFYVCPNRFEFWFNTYNYIDILSAAPLFFRLARFFANPQSREDIAVHEDILPLLRLLKMVRRSRKFHLLISAFRIASEALPVLLFALILMAFFFAFLMLCLEDNTLLPDLPMSLWFVFVTMTTVGYGDVVPETVAGSILAMVLMVSSVLYMAMPLGIVGNAFAKVWNDRDCLLFMSALRETFTVSGISVELVREMFLMFHSGDSDNAEEEQEGNDTNDPEDPELELKDFKKLMHALQIGVPDDRIVLLFEYLDSDGGGSISCEEFLTKLFPTYAMTSAGTSLTRSKSILSTFSTQLSLHSLSSLAARAPDSQG